MNTSQHNQSNSIYTIVAVVCIVVIVGIGFVMFGIDTPSEEAVTNDDIHTDNTDRDNETNTIRNRDGSVQHYQPYSEEVFATLSQEKDIVLFFKASWCPTCKALEDNIQENKNAIPEDLVFLTLDYDTETELKQKYGVTVQHTLVQVNKSGDAIHKWSGGTTLASVVSKLE